MALDDTRSIDFISTSSTPPELILTIVDHLPWDHPEHLRMLSAKIQTYIDFIDSGEAHDRFREIGDLPVRIEVQHFHQPTPDGQSFFERTKVILEGEGISFSWHPITVVEQEAQQGVGGNGGQAP